MDASFQNFVSYHMIPTNYADRDGCVAPNLYTYYLKDFNDIVYREGERKKVLIMVPAI